MSRDGRGGDDVDAIVRAELTALLTKTGRAVPALADDLKLDADLGLTSLEVTTLLVAVTARLEAAQAADVMTDVDIATVGDLRRAVRPSHNHARRAFVPRAKVSRFPASAGARDCAPRRCRPSSIR